MTKKTIAKLFFVVIFVFLGLFVKHNEAKAYTLATYGYVTSQCSAMVWNRIDGPRESNSMFTSNLWIGGNAQWDDQIAWYGMVNDVVYAQGTAGNSFCSSSGSVG